MWPMKNEVYHEMKTELMKIIEDVKLVIGLFTACLEDFFKAEFPKAIRLN